VRGNQLLVGWALDANQNQIGFLWNQGVMYNLNTLIANLPAGVTVFDALAINDQGWIAAQDTTGQACLLIPSRSMIGVLQLLLFD